MVSEQGNTEFHPHTFKHHVIDQDTTKNSTKAQIRYYTKTHSQYENASKSSLSLVTYPGTITRNSALPAF